MYDSISGARQMPEANAGINDFGSDFIVGCDEANRGQNIMRTARQQLQRGHRLFDMRRLNENFLADGHHGISGNDVGVGEVLIVGDLIAGGLGLGSRQPRDQARGISPRLALSSIDAGRKASGVIPTCASSVSRRGLALARTRRGRSISPLMYAFPSQRPAQGFTARRIGRRENEVETGL